MCITSISTSHYFIHKLLVYVENPSLGLDILGGSLYYSDGEEELPHFHHTPFVQE